MNRRQTRKPSRGPVRKPLHFTKMHGLGNDFVVIDLISQHIELEEKHIRQIADRHFGIGCDQVLLVEPPQHPDVDFRYRIYNADGGEVEQCGNGARCFAKFVRDKKLTRKNDIRVETAGGIIELHVTANHLVRVNMGVPVLEPASIPFRADTESASYTIDADGWPTTIGAVSMGNPHAVLFVDDINNAPVESLGPLLEKHPDFPNRVNVGFAQVASEEEIHLRVWERGCGETLACGTGACAAVVAAQLQGQVGTRVKVHLPGGYLWIDWPGRGQPVTMTGPATTVFEGSIL
ncbi:MAG: diaminopimelate epimerase, partial [Gammaproteobacteria bacterium]